MGREYHRGKPLSNDVRSLIVELVQQSGGDPQTGFTPRGTFKQVSDRLHVDTQSVCKIWRRFVLTSSSRYHPTVRNTPRKLLNVEIAYLESLKVENPGMTSREMKVRLSLVSPTDVSERTIRHTVRNYFTEGKWTRKRCTAIAQERFTFANLEYTQNYMDYLYTVEPRRLKFMDESGFKTPTVSHPLYGHSLIGTRCVDIVRYHQSPNTTLNLLVGLDGVMHANTIQGASDSATYTDFIAECVNTVTEYGQPALQTGDISVVDNCPTHHSEVARVLNDWLQVQGIDVIYTPKYSPEFNPAEYCFNKVKTCISNDAHIAELTYRAMPVAIFEALDKVTPADTLGFYRATGYLHV
ncbi:uncharacterized protein [Ptychodera flava]|uniref:uncharacterized protein n=1 Tax=Ptychodera flava TaxID=63121 RepID=UPI003969BE6D